MFKQTKAETGALQERIAKLEAELAEAKQEAEQNWRMLEAVNNSAHLGIWISYYDEKGEQAGVHYSDEMRRMLGYSKTEMPDTFEAFGNIMDPEQAPEIYAAFGAAMEDDRNKYDLNVRLLTKGGKYRTYHAFGKCVRRKDRTPEFFIGTFVDVDDQVAYEARMEHDSRRATAVELMMLEGSWSMDLTKYDISDINSPMVFSDQFKKILGYSGSHDFPDIMNSWITKIHPDDVAGASELMAKQLADPSGATVFDTEYRLMHKRGEYIWVRASSYVVWAQDRRTPLMAAGTILDITENKKNKLRFTEEMAPNIQNLRQGITEIAKTVDMAARQMNEMASRQADVAQAAQRIDDSVDASMGIITSIQSIASQTNLLSLNASIEAARAGEAGKGFAVVASEVQNLSNSTKDTTGQIAEILNGMRDSVSDMLGKISLISENVTDESAEMEEIDATIEQLHKAADEIAQMAEDLYK